MIAVGYHQKKDQFDAITRMPCDYYYIRIQNPHIGGAATHNIKVSADQLEAIRKIIVDGDNAGASDA
jgi:hypothetical protein